MTKRRKIQIISPPNDQLTGVYLPNNLAEQWRSILRLVYPVGISRDFNLVPIPGNPNNDTPWTWGECVKYNSYLLFPHRKGITSKEFCWEFREFCKSFNNTFVYDSTGVTRTMFPWTAIGTAVETKTNYISNMAFSVTRAGRITAIDFAEFGYVDVDAIKQTEHFLSLLRSDCRIIATDISPLIPAKDANPMIITLANNDNWGDAIAELRDFIRLQTGHQTFSTATSEIFKDEAFSEEGGVWKIDIGHAIEKAEDEKKDITEVKIYNTHGVLDGLNFANGVKMSNDVVDQWVTVMKSAYPAIIPGTPVFGIAEPQRMILPRLCPLFVSMTASASLPASKPGPRAMTYGASPLLIPRFFFAMIASTSTAGWKVSRTLISGSTKTGTEPRSSIGRISFSVVASSAFTPSTVTVPS